LRPWPAFFSGFLPSPPPPSEGIGVCSGAPRTSGEHFSGFFFLHEAAWHGFASFSLGPQSRRAPRRTFFLMIELKASFEDTQADLRRLVETRCPQLFLKHLFFWNSAPLHYMSLSPSLAPRSMRNFSPVFNHDRRNPFLSCATPSSARRHHHGRRIYLFPGFLPVLLF